MTYRRRLPPRAGPTEREYRERDTKFLDTPYSVDTEAGENIFLCGQVLAKNRIGRLTAFKAKNQASLLFAMWQRTKTPG